MSQRYGRKIAGRRSKKDESEGYDFQTYAGFSKDSEPVGIREGGDGQASPVNEWPDISDDGELPLTIHSVAVGEVDKSKFGNELGGITDRISKLLHEYESVYDEESSQTLLGASVTGQIYLDNLLSDYHAICQEREEVLESLHDSIDLDEDEILDRLERMTKRSKDDLEGSDRVVKETFAQAKDKFERLRELNKEMMLLSRQDQDVGKLEEEKNELQEELLQYKRMAVQQKMGGISKARKKSLLKKDESLQWKLVAGEMLDIVKGIKLEGKTDKVQLEKDLNMILLAMGGLNDQIDKLKIELVASESNIKKLQEEKVSLQGQNTMKEQELKDKILEVKNCRKLIKKLEEEKKQEAEKALAKEKEVKTKAKEEEFKRPDTFDDIMQAQLRDQKNKTRKLEEQNKELLARIESYKQEEQARKETESNLAQMLSIPGMADCSTCSLLGRQVLTSREEISLLSSKVEELEQQLDELRDQLTQAQEELETAMESQVDVIKRREFIEGQEATSGSPSPTKEVSSESLEAKIESPESEKPRKTRKPARKGKQQKKTEPRKKANEANEAKRKVTEAKTSDVSLKAASDDESKSEDEIQETSEGTVIEGTEKEEMGMEEMGMEEMGMGEMGKEERTKEDERRKEEETRKEKKTGKDERRKEERTRKKKKTGKGEEEDKDHVLKGVGSRQHADENVSYVKVREAKMITLCDTGSQTEYQDRLASISMGGGSRRNSLTSWKASKNQKHSLADAIMSNAPPNVIEEETSIVASVISEEAERLCEDICNFMEYGYDLIEQEEKLLETQAVRHLGEEEEGDVSALKEHLQGREHDTPRTSDRRQGIFTDVQGREHETPRTSHRRQSIFTDVQGRERGTPRTSDRRQSIFTDVQGREHETPRTSDRRQGIFTDVQGREHGTPRTSDRRQGIFTDVQGREHGTPRTSDRRQSIFTDVVAGSDLPPAVYKDAFPSRDRRQSIHSEVLPSRDRRQSIHSDSFPTRDRRQSIHTSDVLPTRDRRQSYYGEASPVPDHLQSLYGDVTPVGDRTRRRSTILQLDLHRDGPMHHQDVTMQHGMAADRIGLLGTDILPEVEDETLIGDKKHEFLRRGGGVRKLSEVRIKKQIATMAQAAINIIKDTGDAFQYRLNQKLGHYEKFYDLWREARQSRSKSVHRSPVAGKAVLNNKPKQDRPVKSREEHHEMEEEEEEETDILLPLISKESKGKPLEQGFMMIGSSSKNEPKTPPPQLPPPRKRGKPKVMTRQQQLMKQKALLEKARHVEAKADTRNLGVQAAGHQSSGSPYHAPKEGQNKPATTSLNQAFNLPFIAHGFGKHEEPPDKKTAITRRLSTTENVQKSLSSWNSNKEGIQKYYSANDVPGFKSEIKTSFRAGRTTKSKLPTLNISNLFGSF